MPQKKYDLTSERGNIEKDFKTEVDRNFRFYSRQIPAGYRRPYR